MTITICSRLDTYLTLCCQDNFTGIFEISNENGAPWRLRFLSGKLVADAGGMLPRQRWQRQVTRYRSNLPLGQFRYSGSLEWNSQILNQFFLLNVISKERASKILDSSVCELLFEVALQELNQDIDNSVNNYRMIWQSELSLEETISVSLDINKVWPQVVKLVARWEHCGWKHISPSSVPTVLNQELLKQLTCDTDFALLPNFLDGSCTLWELAARLKCSIYYVTQAIVALEQNNCVRLAGTSRLSEKEQRIQKMEPSSGLDDVPTAIAL